MAPTKNVPNWENDLARTILYLKEFSQTELSLFYWKRQKMLAGSWQICGLENYKAVQSPYL